MEGYKELALSVTVHLDIKDMLLDEQIECNNRPELHIPAHSHAHIPTCPHTNSLQICTLN